MWSEIESGINKSSNFNKQCKSGLSRSQRPSGLRRRSSPLAVEIAGSNPATGKDVCPFMYVLSSQALRRADHLSKQSYSVCVCVRRREKVWALQ